MRCVVPVLLCSACGPEGAEEVDPDRVVAPSVTQLTFGPSHHGYGYIGHVGNTPFAGDDGSMIALRTGFRDRLPAADEAAEIVRLAPDGEVLEVLDETRAWNQQQGTMLYWDPLAPSERFVFNDRDPATDHVSAVLYDVNSGERSRTYASATAPVGNSGVSQVGGRFAAINYGRLARLRAVTGYPEAYDWTVGVAAPEDDGLFVVDMETGEQTLIVSYARMRDAIVDRHPAAADAELFLNHTLWSRDGERLFFFVRGNFNGFSGRVNVPMTVNADGTDLVEQELFFGGHPEWFDGTRMIGNVGGDLVLVDTETQSVVETLATAEAVVDAEGDTALSPDGSWLVTGWNEQSEAGYTFVRLSDGAWWQTERLYRGDDWFGDARIDPAPCWNRAGDAIVVPAIADDGTKQMFRIDLYE